MIVILHGVPRFGPILFAGYFSKAFCGGLVYVNEHGVQVFEQMSMEEIGQYLGGN